MVDDVFGRTKMFPSFDPARDLALAVVRQTITADAARRARVWQIKPQPLSIEELNRVIRFHRIVADAALRGLAWLKETHAADVEAVVAELHRRGVSLDTIDAPAEVTNSAEPLHVVDQEGQPYGSTRRCCNMCGTALFHDMRYVATCAEWHRRRVRGEPTCADVVSGAG